MKKLIVLLLLISSCTPVKRLIKSDRGCCEIIVYKHKVVYDDDKVYVTEKFYTEDQKVEIISNFIEYCHHNH